MTEIGVIPEDWEVKEVRDIVDFTNGKAHENHISDSGRYIVVNSKFISSEGEVFKRSNESFCIADAGTVLMVMSDIPNGKAIAKCFFVDKDNTYTVNQRICALKPKINAKYLFYKINRNPFYLSFDDGVKQTNLKKDDVLSCKLGIPKSLGEQQAIASVLSDTDKLISSLEALIAKKRTIKEGAMQELLTGKKRLAGFSGEWKVRKLGEIADFYKGKGLPKSDICENGKYKCVHYGELFTLYKERIATIKSSTNSIEGAFLSKENDVLMPTSDVTPNGLATASCIGTSGVVLGGDILIIRSKNNDFDGTFVAYGVTLNRKQIMQLVSGSTVYHLYGSDMAKYEFLCPPTKEEQEFIAKILSDMDAEIAELEAKCDKYKLVKQGLMQVLLTGKIRLI